ncbi:MAG: hypothetical protein K6U89_19365, partial [Chloroflexi bacterium]|nr:hypothetical protein [Chloroflexota bacterium]
MAAHPQGVVGRGEQASWRGTIAGAGDRQPGRDLQLAARGEGWQREGVHPLLDPLEDGGSCGVIRAGQQNGELIPAD